MGITATQNLRFPDATDFVDDMASYIETLARQLDSRMRGHDLDQLRTNTERPFCVLRTSGPQTINSTADPTTSLIKFDTVLVDTDNMADLDNLPQAMTIRTPGWYQFGWYAVCPSTGCTPGTGVGIWQTNSASGGFSNVALFGSKNTQTTDANNGWVPGGSSELGRASTLSPPPTWGWINLLITGTACASLINCQFAKIWAYKVRDL